MDSEDRMGYASWGIGEGGIPSWPVCMAYFKDNALADGRKPPSTAAACRPLPSWKLNRICQEFIARHSGDEQRKYHAYAVLMQGHNLRPRPYEEWVANYRKAKERRVA